MIKKKDKDNQPIATNTSSTLRFHLHFTANPTFEILLDLL